MLETHLRHVATVLLESATRFAPADTREWGRAMHGELRYVDGCWAVLMWVLGGASVMAKHALVSILLPGRYGQGLTPDGGLFAKNVSRRKAALVASGVCVLGALLFLAGPPFRQGMQVALSALPVV
jgi:succinate dehydrogenase/fumarate reductase cytochrome b subunit